MKLASQLSVLGCALALVVNAACSAPAVQPFTANVKDVRENGAHEFVSPEKVKLDAAMAQAKAEGKLLLVDYSAAWCGPCMAFKKDYLENKDGLKDAIHSQFVFVAFEETHTNLPWGYWDFIPVPLEGVPTFMMVDPATGQKTGMSGYGEPENFKAQLSTFAAEKAVGTKAIAKLKAALSAGNAPLTSDDVFNALGAFPWEASASEILALWNEIVAVRAQKPELFPEDVFDKDTWSYAQWSVVSALANSGDYTLEQVVEPYAQVTGEPFKHDVWLQEITKFNAPMSKLVRTQGTLAAARACDAVAAAAEASPFKWEPKPIPEGATDEKKKEIEDGNKWDTEYVAKRPAVHKRTCGLLKAATGLLSKSEIMALVEAGAAEEKPAFDDLVRLAVFAGEFTRGKEFLQKSISESDEYTAKSLKEIEEKLSKAQASGDQDAIAKAQGQLERYKFKMDAMKHADEQRMAALNAGVTHPLLLKP